MKRRYLLQILAIVVAALVSACSAKKEESADEHGHSHEHEADAEGEEWKEMDEFHIIMAEAFHPYKDSANLEPAKANAESMALAADKWASASLPEKVDNDDVKEKLQVLKQETAAFLETVKGGDDQAIGNELTSLHDHFHELQEVWYGGSGHHHH